MKVELTKSQCNSVVEFIETNLLDVIRKNIVIMKDIDIENLGYVIDLLIAKTTLKKAVNEYEGN